jgi:hypothetical protein
VDKPKHCSAATFRLPSASGLATSLFIVKGDACKIFGVESFSLRNAAAHNEWWLIYWLKFPHKVKIPAALQYKASP